MARTKKRGSGKQIVLHAYRGAQMMRWLADGQLRNGRVPGFMRKTFGRARRNVR